MSATTMCASIVALVIQTILLADPQRIIIAPLNDAVVDPKHITVAWSLPQWQVARPTGAHAWIAIGDGHSADDLGRVQLLHHIDTQEGEAAVSAEHHPGLRSGARAALIVLRVERQLNGQVKSGYIFQMPRERMGPGYNTLAFQWITIASSPR
jgi:hypothetical protein